MLSFGFALLFWFRPMKKLLVFISFFLIIGIILNACTSPKKLFEKGNYYDAVILSVEKLQSNSNNKNVRETLAQAYVLAVDDLLDKIEKNKIIQPEFSNSFAVYTYEDLNRMYEKILKSPAARQIIKIPKDFYRQIALAKPLAAEEQYIAGMKQLIIGSRESSKQAYYYFQDADAFVKGYKDVDNRLDQSYKMALLHVIADFKPVHSRIYKLSSNSFYNELENTLQKIEKSQFVRFYSPMDAKKLNLENPDQILKINFEDFIIGETHTQERIEKMVRDSVIVGSVNLDNGRKKNVYGTVKAKVYLYKMQVISKGIVGLTILENNFNKTTLIDDLIPGEYIWFNEWGNYNGDLRALNKKQKEISKRRKILPPPAQQMFIEFTKPIHEQLRVELINFYQNY